MDQKDEFILNSMIRNSRMPLIHLAKELDITDTAVRKRIKKLEKVGAIKAYTALVDPFFIGFSGVALVGLDAKPEKLLSVFEKIKSKESVRYSALTSGDHMIMFEIWCRDEKSLNQELKLIEKMDGVTRVCPAVILKRVE